MSFGFSPGDIVWFISFSTKVVNALREHGGSKVQYQLAEQQCQGFLDIMEEVKRLDLSGVPEAFRRHIEQQCTNVSDFVVEFKNGTQKYDRSMGEYSEKGWLGSAPRKVQWALSAAADLETFRQSLSAQLDLVKLAIQTSILTIVSQGHGQNNLPGLTRSQPLRGQISGGPRGRGYLEWHADPARSMQMLDQVDGIADMVYERLLTRPGLPLQDHGRIHTLPDSIYGERQNLSLPLANGIQRTPDNPTFSSGKELRRIDDKNMPPEGRLGDDKSPEQLSVDINEYLRSLNLSELTEDEAIQVDNAPGTGQGLLEFGTAAQRDGEPKSSREAKPEHESTTLPSSKRSRFRSPFSGGFGIDPISMIALAAGTIQVVDQAARVAYSLRNVRDAPNELLSLSSRIIAYSELLRIVADVIHTCMASEPLQKLGLQILSDSARYLSEVMDVVKSFDVQSNRPFRSIFKRAMWSSRRAEVLQKMEELESMKSTLSLMLQTQQLQSAGSSLGVVGKPSAGDMAGLRRISAIAKRS